MVCMQLAMASCGNRVRRSGARCWCWLKTWTSRLKSCCRRPPPPPQLLQRPPSPSPSPSPVDPQQHPLTLEDLDKLLAGITAEVERLDPTRGSSSSIISVDIRSLLSKWEERKDMLANFVESHPQAYTKEVTPKAKDVLLPLVQTALGGAGNVHWLGLGCLFIAWSLENVNRTNQNYEQFLHVLRRIVRLLNQIKEIWKMDGDDDIQELQDIVEKAFQCALLCTSNLNESYLLRFFKAPTSKDAILQLTKELDTMDIEKLTYIAKEILKSTSKLKSKFEYTGDTVTIGGDEERNKAMAYLQKESSDILAVCLHGMGGIGKSTLGMRIYREFERLASEKGESLYRCCREELPFEVKSEDYLRDIQIGILEKVCKYKTHRISNCTDGRYLLEREFKKLKNPIFLYLDNVLDEEHLSKVLPKASCFYMGSRLLVTTTRHAYIKNSIMNLGITNCELIQVQKLEKGLARELLWQKIRERHGGNATSSSIEHLEEKVLSLCDGLPLAIKVVSSYIAESESLDAKTWSEVVEAMENAKPLGGGVKDPLYASLMFSIELLDRTVRSALLDIVAMQAKAWSIAWEFVERLVGYRNLKVLCERALCERAPFPGNQVGVKVHDVLKAMCMQMQENSKDEIRIIDHDSFKKQLRLGCLENVVGLNGVRVKACDLEKMVNLRFMYYVTIEGECQRTIKFNNLKVVETMRSKASSSPFNFNKCESLKSLQWVQNDGVKVLTDEHISRALEWVALRDWKQLENVDVIQRLSNLKFLQLGSTSIQSLPEGISKLTHLEVLALIDCERLESLPEGLGNLKGLKDLSLNGCRRLECLPEGVTCLTNLTQLNVAGCTSLISLPPGIGSLQNLASLDLGGCASLQTIPVGIGGLQNLASLDLGGCASLQNLASLDLGGCESLQSIPDVIGSLTTLERLDVQGCGSLRSLPTGISMLTHLQMLDFSDCAQLESIEGVDRLLCLRELLLDGCENLQALPEGLSSLTDLEELSLAYCSSLQSMLKGPFPSLLGLILFGCHSLRWLPLEFLSLRRLGLCVCTLRMQSSLSEVFAKFTSLLLLSVCVCPPSRIEPALISEKFTTLPEGLASLTSLTDLELHSRESPQCLLQEGFATFTFIKDLSLSESKNLTSLPQGFDSLTGLTSLDLTDCSSLQSLPAEISNLTRLRFLDLSNCKGLESLPEEIGSLRSLQWLNLSGCESLHSLPKEIASLECLELLNLWGCNKISIHSLPEGLTNRKGLYIKGLHTLPGAGEANSNEDEDAQELDEKVFRQAYDL